MEAAVKILNVGDGDAIIVKLKRGDDKFLMVIDGGDKGSVEKILKEVGHACEEMRKGAPDLVVCTHYDSDHIAGIIALVEKYGNSIGEIWVHIPYGIMTEAFRILRDPNQPENGRRLTIMELLRTYVLERKMNTEGASLLYESIRSARNVAPKYRWKKSK